ncbi:sugar phosphate isomerase/epimerase [Vibrio europaeus]|uniref:Sugar phosphate isomerase/epimerase n=1 Tax=Vibrio europaeus TaxID=300876 RepID=A0AAE7AXD9_9VIBR|nr:sugar phosphate isomerase/epimerase family protein [Vibrio europaeus]MDC5805781.1 sugar phosphate isomerase/epimerase [Vibrio europaeus]MDC5812078.1 sugar phosphate isomerase/epimerase [Vibrio europaeus]MDC5826145.1 sugar phosphate isomerase/epimerase [Vibrio europaeus]MDC5831510.1 sugar phosphate isomerase/epimerase [Vibrio europaeus]MDC5834465.1 sugar phosphate isomerase/epimerase [Vibrio europaeus]
MSILERLAINTAIFDGHDLKTSLKTIKGLGVNEVEFAFNQGYVGQLDSDMFSANHAQYLISLLDKEGLTTQALGCTMNLAVPGAIEDFMMRIDFAHQLGVTYLNTCTGPIADRHIIIANLKVLAEYAQEKGCVICIENGGDHNFNAFASAHDGVRILSEVESAGLALNFDPGNSVSLVPNLSPSEEAKIALPFCRHFHVKDVQVHDDKFTFPALGEGIINYQPIVESLAARQIPFSIEKPLRMYRRKDSFPIRGRAPESMENIINALTQSIDYLKNVAD